MGHRLKTDFYKHIWRLFLPIVVQNLLGAAVSSTDVVMLNFVGQSSISAVSLAANYANILFMVYYGLGTGATLLCAQYYGKGDFRAIEIVQSIAMRFSLSISILAAAAVFFLPDKMMQLFTADAELIAIGASYLRVMGVTYICWSVIEIYLSVLRSVGRATVSMALHMVAFVLNIGLNAVFIFGFFGAPRMGATGVAIATAISRVVELIACFAVSAASKDVKLRLGSLFVRNALLQKDFITRSIPAMLNDLSWSVAFSMYSVILGHLGNDVVAANSLVVVVRNITTTFCFAVASSGGVLLGNVMGKGDMDKARDYASHMMRLTVLTAALGSVVILLSIPAVLHFASVSDTAMHYLKNMLLINSYYIVGAAVNTSLIAGIFRAGGDTKFGMICDTIDMWCYAVPLGFFSAFVLKLPVMWVYFLLCTDEFVKWPWVLRRYFSGKWMQNITRDSLYEGQ